MKPNINDIFNSSSASDFKSAALAVFRYQAENNAVYRQFIASLRVDPKSVNELEKIPFLPIEFFKTHEIISGNLSGQETIFLSSGTTGMKQSKHFVSDISIYEKSYLNAFELFYGNIEDYVVLALLPSYLEREGSSLVFMANDLIAKSKHSQSGFYLHNYDELIAVLTELKNKKQKTILLGVTYALLDLTELLKNNIAGEHLTVMETGGMKGKRKEMIREELHEILCKGLNVQTIHSEYGMTELLSQAYSKGNGLFVCPPWMKIMIRDTNDPFSFLPENRTGGINIIDLANIHSCSFLATQDLGKRFSDGSFEVLGRFDNSDLRGCNLMVE